jgi:hypothetical protein
MMVYWWRITSRCCRSYLSFVFLQVGLMTPLSSLVSRTIFRLLVKYKEVSNDGILKYWWCITRGVVSHTFHSFFCRLDWWPLSRPSFGEQFLRTLLQGRSSYFTMNLRGRSSYFNDTLPSLSLSPVKAIRPARVQASHPVLLLVY